MLMLMSEITGGNLASFKASAEIETGPRSSGPVGICAKLPQSPAVPVTMMMVVMAMMVVVPAMPPMMVVVVAVMVMSPMHFRRRQPGILLNRCGGAGIAERQRIGALGRSGKRQQGTNGRKPKNLHYLHIQSPRVVGCTSAPNGLHQLTASPRHVHRLKQVT
ncbi:hypothetical protein V1292_001764 [Bradyrhizobium sp. AZCC 1719]|uniref:hypothetical protein n=1 Tax=Bradyrhizobium sp. AZCC 1719 TaxID=3117028 RepID=UPI002FF3DBFF